MPLRFNIILTITILFNILKETSVTTSDTIVIKDPPKCKDRGRPKLKKIGNMDANVAKPVFAKKKRTVHCSFCKQSGHYDVTCRAKQRYMKLQKEDEFKPKICKCVNLPSKQVKVH